MTVPTLIFVLCALTLAFGGACYEAIALHGKLKAERSQHHKALSDIASENRRDVEAALAERDKWKADAESALSKVQTVAKSKKAGTAPARSFVAARAAAEQGAIPNPAPNEAAR